MEPICPPEEPGGGLGDPWLSPPSPGPSSGLITRHAAPTTISWLTNTCCSLCLEGPLLATTWPVSSPCSRLFSSITHQESNAGPPSVKLYLPHHSLFPHPALFLLTLTTWYVFIYVSRLAVHHQWPSPGWNLHKAAVLHFVSHLSKPPRRMLGRNDKISGVCFKGFYRTKIRCCVWESRQTHVINGPRQNACLSFCYYHR